MQLSTAITIPIFAHDVNGDGVTGIADGSFTKRISKNGAAFAAMTVTIVEMENGWYSLPLSATHTDTAGILTVSLSAAAAKRVNLQWRVGVPEANLIQIDGLATTGNNATLNLKQLNVVNSTGTAIVGTSTGGGGHGASFLGQGAGHGLLATGGGTNGIGIRGVGVGSAAGIEGQGAGAAGHGIRGVGGATGSHGVRGEGSGTGSGGSFVGGSSSGAHGLVCQGGSTAGNGARFVGIGDFAGLLGLGGNGGAAGHGIAGQSGTGGGNGVNGLAGAASAGHGIAGQGDTTGEG
ncbi:MAG: hypothetical protein ACREIB_10865, partial [Pseudomonadota bacterium]